MDYRKEVVAKIRAIIAALFELLLFWMTKSLHPCIAHLMCTTAQILFHVACKIFYYIKIKASCPTPRPSSSSYSCALFESVHDAMSQDISNIMSDVIGTDSGVFVGPFEDIVRQQRERKPCSIRPTMLVQRRERKKKEFPPPLPALVQTDNFSPRMPLKFTKHYVDGRLILREVRIRHYKYFETSRESGRRTLNLVPLDNTIPCHIPNMEHKEIKEIEEIENDTLKVDDEKNVTMVL